ncbi:unnamed protein product, partial [Rotaria socialis]
MKRESDAFLFKKYLHGTNNALEATNRVIKDEDTLRER